MTSALLQVLDRTMLASLQELEDDGEPGFVVDVLRMYQSSLAARLGAIRSAIEGSAAESLRRAAHTLKGSSATLGAEIAADLSGELEELGRAGTTEGGMPILARLEAQVGTLTRVLRAEYPAAFLPSAA